MPNCNPKRGPHQPCQLGAWKPRPCLSPQPLCRGELLKLRVSWASVLPDVVWHAQCLGVRTLLIFLHSGEHFPNPGQGLWVPRAVEMPGGHSPQRDGCGSQGTAHLPLLTLQNVQAWREAVWRGRQSTPGPVWPGGRVETQRKVALHVPWTPRARSAGSCQGPARIRVDTSLPVLSKYFPESSHCGSGG